ncbi:MAG: AEC family transporter, partial [Planctomycetota bacterium]
MKGPLLLAIVGTAALAFHVPSSVAVRKKSRVVSCRAVHHPTLSPAALGVATGAVARLVTVCGLGATYAKLGVLDAAACATLSRLIYFIFQPAMLFVNCAGTISSTTGAWRLAALPAFAATQIGLGLMFGWAALLREKNRNSVEARELRALCAFGNAGPLPFVFAEGFFRSQPELLARAVAYISFYLVGWSPLFWTLGPMILEGSTKVSLKKIASPPVLASVFGVLVGSQASVAHFLFQGPARPLLDSLRLLGQAYLPCVALVLAGTLARSLDSSPKQSDDDF